MKELGSDIFKQLVVQQQVEIVGEDVLFVLGRRVEDFS